MFPALSGQHLTAIYLQKSSFIQSFLRDQQKPHLPIGHPSRPQPIHTLAGLLECLGVLFPFCIRQRLQSLVTGRSMEIWAQLLKSRQITRQNNPICLCSTQVCQDSVHNMVPSRVLKDLLRHSLRDDSIVVKGVGLLELLQLA